jgi:hypothetical protein
MATVEVYTLRTGRPIPIIGGGGSASGAVQYTFGSECQKVITCAADDEVVHSDEFCLLNTDPEAYWSASYRALPVKIDDKVKYNSTITVKPKLLSSTGGCAGSGGNCSLISF